MLGRVTRGLQLRKLATEDPGALFFDTFDTRAPFEQWIRSLPEKRSGFRLDAFAAFCSEVNFFGLLRVDGPMKSNIRSADGTLMMTEQAHIQADVDVRIAVIDGCLEGNLKASHHVILEGNARVEGNIHTPSLTVRDGAVF
jgi:hypothetical protein